MTRARSGSFYCPIPDESMLSIAQKAAISTAPTASPSLTTVSPVGGRLRRHVRSPSTCSAFELAPVAAENQQHHHNVSAARDPLSAICHDKTTTTPCGSIPSTSTLPIMYKRHPWSPVKPSPLRRVFTSASSKPLPPSALWTTHTELLPLYASQQDEATSSQPQLSAAYRTNHLDVAPRQSFYRHTLRLAFLAGPMAEKARCYGLRVAWCIYGDIKEQLAKEIFVSGVQAGYSLSSPSRRRRSSSSSISSVESEDLDNIEVVHPELVEMIRSRPVVPARTPFEWGVEAPLMKEDDAFESPSLSSLEEDDDSEDSVSEYSSFSDTSSDTESVEIEELEFDHEFALDFGVIED